MSTILSNFQKKMSSFPLKTFGGIYGLMFLGFLLSFISSYNNYGILPRNVTLGSIYGVFMSWTMHGDWGHVLNNMISMFPLLLIMFFVEKSPIKVFGLLTVLTGLFTWLFGSTGIHIGASGIVFALIGFILLSSFLRRKWIYLLFVFFSFGEIWFSIRSGWIPQQNVSFAAHFGGFLVGVVMAYYVSGEDGKARLPFVSKYGNKIKQRIKKFLLNKKEV